ncbi:uncharacterized protein Z520_07437 [Fonsecaea multimorphosa CBS 102226]|uniref:Uncharacterized protein n=1 Tax=Fonsecaea multimorphosa CBS 102226 TaxID=1442371 RepID=A0A0D2KJE5_9EURO|nr:uncharacterized protein Z520_07437 [Fonsecaea multimorphosa CBS 102226]KIX96718.1 hypothetical protein Z520_07437 [Fonsecaea multimorphosa CBS 102226]OAL22685.1 hypothetical protein AYO22_06956 [Fonsecaea multimorphosa]
MAYSVLLLGATSRVGRKTLKELALHRQHFSRVAFLLPPSDSAYQKEIEYGRTTLECIVGSPSDSKSYQGFQIVISTVEDDVCAKQTEYAEAAFAGGVKHLYSAEYGPDLNHPAIRDELYFVGKIVTRKYIEGKMQADTSLGFTCVMTGALSDFLLESNVLGLSEDQRSVVYLGHPDARISVTHSDDVAKLIVASLLPHHLSDLNLRRYLCFAASTIPTLSLFDAISYVLRHPIDVTYEEGLYASSYKTEHSEKAMVGNDVQQSFRRSVGFGGFELKEQDIAHWGGEFRHEVKAKTWAQVVHEFYTSSDWRSALIK